MDFENVDTEDGIDNVQELVTPIESDKIEFAIKEDWVGKYAMPEPAHKHKPDWYKNLPLELSENQTQPGGASLDKTVRACMPFLEALTLGWIIRVPADIKVGQRNGETVFSWDDLSHKLADSHFIEQLGGDNFDYPDKDIMKFNLPYLVRTPEGYSTLFMPPLNRFNKVFKPFSGVVDTDEHIRRVNIPAILLEDNWTGVIEKGTPICQIVPFERDSILKESIKRTRTQEEAELRHKVEESIQTNDALYRKNIWHSLKQQKDNYESDEFKDG